MKTKKFLSLLLSVIMCLSLFTYPAFAEEFVLASYNLNASVMDFKFTKDVTTQSATLTDGTNTISILSEIKADDPSTVVIKPTQKLDLSKSYSLTVTASDGANSVTVRKGFSFTVMWDENFDSYTSVADLEDIYKLRKLENNSAQSSTISAANETSPEDPYVTLVDDSNGGKKLGLKAYNNMSFTNNQSIVHWYTVEATIEAEALNLDVNRDPYFAWDNDYYYSLRLQSAYAKIPAFEKVVEGSTDVNSALVPTTQKFDFVLDADLPSADAESGILSLYYNGALAGRFSDIGKYHYNSQLATDANWGTADTCKDKVGFKVNGDTMHYIDNIRVYKVNEFEINELAVTNYSMTSQFIRINYNQSINPASVNDANITFKSLTDGDIAFTKSFENDNKTLVLKPAKTLDITHIYKIDVNGVKSADGYSEVDFNKGIKFDYIYNENFDSYETIADIDNAGYKLKLNNNATNLTLSQANDATTETEKPFVLVDDGNGGKRLGMKNYNSAYFTNATKKIKHWYTIELTIDPNGGRPLFKINRDPYFFNSNNSHYTLQFTNTNWMYTYIPCFSPSEIYGQDGGDGVTQNKAIVAPQEKFSMIYDTRIKNTLSIYYDGSLKKTFSGLSYKVHSQQASDATWGTGDDCYERFGIRSTTTDRYQYIDDLKVYRTEEVDLSLIEELKETDREITSQVIRVTYSKAFTTTPNVTIKANGVALENTAVTTENSNTTLVIRPQTALDLYKNYELTISNVKDEYGQNADSTTKFKFDVYWDEDFDSYTSVEELDEYYELVGNKVSPNKVSDVNSLVTDGNGGWKLQINPDKDTDGSNRAFRKTALRHIDKELLKYCTVEFTATSDKEEGGVNIGVNRHEWSWPQAVCYIYWANNNTYRYITRGLFSGDQEYYTYDQKPLTPDEGTGILDRNVDITLSMQNYDDENDRLTIYYDGIVEKNITNKGKFRTTYGDWCAYGNIGFFTSAENTEYIDNIKVYDVVMLEEGNVYSTLTDNIITENGVSGKVYLENLTDDPISPMVVIAAYSNDGKLLGTDVKYPTNVTSTDSVDYSITASDIETVKAYIWTTGLAPVTTYVEDYNRR